MKPRRITEPVVAVNKTVKFGDGVELDTPLVQVTIEKGMNRDALWFGKCSGRIGRLLIRTGSRDGVKVHSHCHDLEIESFHIECYDREPLRDNHQQPVHVMGGHNIMFKDGILLATSATGPSWPVFMSAGHKPAWHLDEVIFSHCWMRGHPDRINVYQQWKSINSGVRECTIVGTKNGSRRGFRQAPTAEDAVNWRSTYMPVGSFQGDPSLDEWAS